MEFIKMHGAGNDFILVDTFREPEFTNSPIDARSLCRPHFGIGADGVIVLSPSQGADARMEILNSDGSSAEMCGNGLRCAVKYLYDEGRVGTRLSIETGAGVLRASIDASTGEVRTYMGKPEFTPANIPLLAEQNTISIVLGGRSVVFSCVSMGNPHAVALDYYPDREIFLHYGAQVEHNARFPNRVNVEFCRILSPEEVEIRVWERGDGETLACGTGACAVFAVGRQAGRLHAACRMHLPGGELLVREEPDGELSLSGPVAYVYRGILYP